MSNPGGGNQFGNYQIQPKYGDVKKQTTLLREAPISGAPFAAHALETPRRSQKQATRPQGQQQAPVPPVAGLAQAPTVPTAEQWQQIAAIPGASPLVQAFAAQAQNGG